ncbi:RNA polymerase subunit sigma-24 [Paenibacillus odorifer]|uniref:RNA polymerase subunit sigma-24 n=2 Tax=Paenibacillus odorifer TaxID=189426 RepID=A0A1R0X9E4_9BACL|nr:RNA polymerase subunit sigma-24 [Paenibacillus odorifer]
MEMSTAEQRVIEQLQQYPQKRARIQALSTYSVGAGLTISRLDEDDQLQELHRRLRGLPSYMYLSEKEQRLETTAHAYLTRYPAGLKAQLEAIPTMGADVEDDKLLQELRRKIKKVIDARGCNVDDLAEVLERVAELQDLVSEVNWIDNVLDLLEKYKPGYPRLLRMIYFENMTNQEIVDKMNVSKTTLHRLRKKAEIEYIALAK